MTSRPFGSTRKIPPGRGSNSALKPSHRISLAGSVRNSKTISGGASMRMSLTIGPSSTWCPRLAFGLALQMGQRIIPKRVEECPQVPEPFGAEPVQPPRAFSPLGQKTCVHQDTQVLRYGGSRGLEPTRDLAGRSLPAADELEDRQTFWLGERSQHMAHVAVRLLNLLGHLHIREGELLLLITCRAHICNTSLTLVSTYMTNAHPFGR